MRRAFGLLAAVAASVVSIPVAAATAETGRSGTSFGLELRGDVQLNCQVRIGATLVASTAGPVDLGGMNEFCNSASGYDVFVDFAPEMAGATLLVDGKPVVLAGSGTIRLSGEPGPTALMRSLQLDAGTASLASAALSFRIVPR